MTDSRPTITIAYAAPDEATAKRLADDLHEAGYALGDLRPGGILVAVISGGALQDTDFNNTVLDALDGSNHMVLVQTAPIDKLPKLLDHLQPLDFFKGYDAKRVAAKIEALSRPGLPPPPRALTPRRRAMNQRNGWVVGVVAIGLFVIGLIAIITLDIESPPEEFEALYTRDAATIGAFAQPFIPRSTEEAANLPQTLQAFEVSDELATVIVMTATEAAARGGFTPVPTGLIIGTSSMSEVRQTATGAAIQTEGVSEDSIAATATAAAADAQATIDAQRMTVTAAAGE